MLPILITQAAIEVTAIGIAVSLASGLISKRITNQKRMKEIKEKMTGLQKRMAEARKSGNQDEIKRLEAEQKQLAPLMKEMMVGSFKPMMITFIPLLLVLGFLGSTYGNYGFGWKYTEFDSKGKLSGDRTRAWFTEGEFSYEIRNTGGAAAGDHVSITQPVRFSNHGEMRIDVWHNVTNGGITLDVLADSEKIYSKELRGTANETISFSTQKYEGERNLTLNLSYSTDAPSADTIRVDNIRWEEGAPRESWVTNHGFETYAGGIINVPFLGLQNWLGWYILVAMASSLIFEAGYKRITERGGKHDDRKKEQKQEAPQETDPDDQKNG
ncbi:TMCO1/EMC3 family protein [Candidatus Micrarchaeota archaeon]|nr:TMCO1/EMC3 family protein [Candidatus Micrarchaeota archaeon]